MRVALCLGLAVGGCAYDGGPWPPHRGGAGATSPVVIVTWNTERFPLSVEAPAIIQETIESLDADVVGIQEVDDPPAFWSLANAMTDYDAVLADDPGAFIRVGLLYNHTRVTLTGTRTLYSDDGYAFPRPPLEVGIEVAGFDFILVVLHLKAQIDRESEARRADACKKLHAYVEAAMASGPEQDYILLGDFNDELLDEPSHNVFTPFLDRPAVYRFLTMSLAKDGAVSYLPFARLIDHVLVTSDALVEYGTGSTKVPALHETNPNYESSVSDHLPVVSTFSLP